MKYLFLLGSSLVLATPALAAEGSVDAQASADEQITVLATGQSAPVDETGQSIAVAGVQEIEAIQGPDITRVLQRLPGVTLTRNGGLGSFTGVRIRGADSEQTLVLVDGARLADVSSPGSGFDFGTLLPANIEKIELLRGSNSVVWGSDAIGGVVAVTTRQLKGVDASAEYGSRNTFSGNAAAGFVAGELGLTLDGGYTRTDGISALVSDSELDGFEQWQAGGRAKYDFGGGFSAFVDARYARSKTGLDFTFANNYVQTTRQASGRTGIAYASDALDLTAAYSIADTRRAYDSPGFGYGYTGRDQQAELRGRWKALPGTALVFGASQTWDRYDGTFDARQSAKQTSGYLMLDHTGSGFDLAAGLRLDHHDRFGDAWSVGANGSYAIGDGWRLRASYGEGFKAPTLYQLYGFAGNSDLVPERSRSYEAGIERGNRNGTVHYGLTVFRRDSRNLIDYDQSANDGMGGYFNAGNARATGFELEGDVRPVDALQLRAAYSYVESINRSTGKDLARRPRHALTLSADWTTPLHALALGADLRFVGDSFDDVDNTVKLKGYAVTDLRASLPVTEKLELFGRVENVTDEKYQMVAGYNTPGRSAFAGVRARF